MYYYSPVPVYYVANPQYTQYYQQDMRQNQQKPNEQALQQEIISATMSAIKGEAAAVEFYTRLKAIAPNSFAKEQVDHALEDEKVHLRMFEQLYQNLTGRKPTYKIEKTSFKHFQDGLKKAYHDELEAYEEYRNAYLLTNNPTIRDVFFHAMTDEIEHATRFSFLFFNEKINGKQNRNLSQNNFVPYPNPYLV